jgi:hypothetical protein
MELIFTMDTAKQLAVAEAKHGMELPVSATKDTITMELSVYFVLTAKFGTQ